MRRAVTPAIPPSMYRHFAILTLVLTAALAMFAKGENREAQAAPAVQAVKPTAPATLVAASSSDASAAGWSDVESFDGGFGGSMEGLLGSGDSGAIPDLEEGMVPGYPRASLSEEERELLLGGLRGSGTLELDIQSRGSAASNQPGGSVSADE